MSKQCIEIEFSYLLGVEREVLGIDPKPEYNWGQQRLRRLFQILNVFKVPVEWRYILKHFFYFLVAPLLNFWT